MCVLRIKITEQNKQSHRQYSKSDGTVQKYHCKAITYTVEHIKDCFRRNIQITHISCTYQSNKNTCHKQKYSHCRITDIPHRTMFPLCGKYQNYDNQNDYFDVFADFIHLLKHKFDEIQENKESKDNDRINNAYKQIKEELNKKFEGMQLKINK